MKALPIITALVILASACGGDSATSPPAPTVAGDWYLVSIYGEPLPAGDGTWSYPSGHLTTRSNGTFDASTEIRGPFTNSSGQTTIQTVSDAWSGTWAVSAGKLTMTVPIWNPANSPGFFNVNTVTVDWGDTGYQGYQYSRR